MQAVYEGKGEVAQLSSDLKSIATIKSFEKLQAGFAETTGALVDAKAKVRLLKAEMRKPGGDAFAEEYKKATGEVAKLSKKMMAQKDALDKTRTGMQDQGIVMSDLSGHYKKLNKSTETHGKKMAAMRTLGVRSFTSIEREVDGLRQAYKHLEKDGSLSVKELNAHHKQMKTRIKALTGETNKWAGMMGKVKAGIAGLAGLTAGGFILGRQAKAAGEAAKELQNFARIAGTSVEEFSALAYATESVGVSQEKLADISKDVKDKIGDFIETGGGEFKDFFDNIAPQVGITAEELQKLSGPDALIAVKKALDDANVSSANQVFYLEGLANDVSLLTPLLEDNGRAMKEKAKHARELGLTISDMDNAKLVEMAQTMKDLDKSGAALSREIITALAPSIKVLIGYVQAGVTWFKNLSPAMQKFIIMTTLAAVGALALGTALYPLASMLKIGFQALGPMSSGLQKLIIAYKGSAFAAKLFGAALKAIGWAGALLMAWELGQWIGRLLNNFAVVRKFGLGLTEMFVMLGLRAKQAWAWITGGDTKAVAKEIEIAKATFTKMYAEIESGADRQVNKSTSAQEAITREVAKGGKKQILIAQETARQMAAAYASVEPGGKKGGKKEEVDEFGYTKAERKSQAEELAKLDAIRRKPRKGKLYNDDGVWKYSGDPEGKKDTEPDREKEKNSSTTKRASAKKDDTRDEFGYTKAERKSQALERDKLIAGKDLARGKRMQKQQLDEAIADNTAPILNPVAAKALDLVNSKIAALGDLSNLGQNEQKSSERIVKLKIGAATLTTDESGYSSFMDELQRAGLVAE